MTFEIGDPRLPERFWSKVEPDESGCWLWAAGKDRDGYGGFRMGSGNTRAHRTAYQHLVGEIAAGLVIDHLCRVRSCVNPAHLEPVANKVNVLRGVGPCAVNAQKTHCIHGHELTDDNISPWNLPKRNCLICMRATRARYLERLAAKAAA